MGGEAPALRLQPPPKTSAPDRSQHLLRLLASSRCSLSHRPPQASLRPAWGILVTPDSPPVSSSHWEDLLCFRTGAACVRLAGLSGDVRCRLSLSHFHGRGAIYPRNSFPGGWGCGSLARKSIEKLRSLRKVTGPCGKCSGPAGPWVPPGHCPGGCTAVLGHRWRYSELPHGSHPGSPT